jgi:transcriptional regulator
LYIPASFEEHDRQKLHAFIEENSFGLLVSMHEGAPFATHLPLLLESDVGPNGWLIGHVARANPQWREADGQMVLAIFSGPHAYVSPSFYESENVVPTWNYLAVHVYGKMRILDDIDSLTEILTKSVSAYEQSRDNPWALEANSPYFKKMAGAIVGFRIEIDRLEGKWKLSQNHPPERQQKVRDALEKSARPEEQQIAWLMAQRMKQLVPQNESKQPPQSA